MSLGDHILPFIALVFRWVDDDIAGRSTSSPYIALVFRRKVMTPFKFLRYVELDSSTGIS